MTANSEKQAREGGGFAAHGRAPGRALAGTREADFARPGDARFTRELGGGFAAREAHKCASGAGAGGGFAAASRSESRHEIDDDAGAAALENALAILSNQDASRRAKATASMGRRCARATRSLSTPTRAHMTHPLRGDGKARRRWPSASYTSLGGLYDMRQTAARIKHLRAATDVAAQRNEAGLYHECHTPSLVDF